ncbi:MAG: endopeptidase La [Chlorobi bacterium]|nr:endopeptidase La [Chlorobiota bacterium]
MKKRPHFDILASMIDVADSIPLMSEDEMVELLSSPLPEELPVLTLRNNVLFPVVVIPVSIGRDQSIRLIEDALKGDKFIGVTAQRNPSVDRPGPDDIYHTGTMAKILRVIKTPDGNLTVIIQGIKPFRIKEFTATEPYLRARVEEVEEIRPPLDSEYQAIINNIRDLALEILRLNPALPSQSARVVESIDQPDFLVNFIISNLDLPVREKQRLFEIPDIKKRAYETLQLLQMELNKLKIKREIELKTQKALDKQSREYFLHQQIRTIQEELGDATAQEIEEMRRKAAEKKWSEEVARHFDKELKKLQRMNPQMAEYAIQRNYLETLLDLPWNEYSEDKFDLKEARRILDRDHFGLDDVKKRIIEYLAVLKLKKDMKAPILLLYGPPGVGKTSLGKSIAEAVGRKYVRMSLGGLRDEAEIRGHRKTYIGAMPGRIIRMMKKAGTSNPVFILDELDKIGSDYKGDPSSALLEVLDPEQNKEFYDNFLEVPYDLSRVMFIGTANYFYDIPWALRDRLEVIPISGYTIEEKTEIAKRHLIPKLLEEHGLKESQFKIRPSQIQKVIVHYTRESGVRGLEKMLAKLIRHRAKQVAMEEDFKPSLTLKEIKEILGKEKYPAGLYEKNVMPGVVTGLAWTRTGGDILFVEAVTSKGKGLTITGNLGKVMRESADIALEYIKANAEKFGVDAQVFDSKKIHIHVPEGATPKDGPSAGVTLFTAILSALTGRKVKPRVAMTGEITLRGKVLPVGGIKEKILAAKRAKYTDIILPEENKKDVEEIKPEYLEGLNFHFVKRTAEIPKLAFEEEEKAPKRRGRPPKARGEETVAAEESAPPKRKRGRPPKKKAEETGSTSGEAPKKRRGRPPKAKSEEAGTSATPKRKRGRPPKKKQEPRQPAAQGGETAPAPAETPKKRRGRPPKKKEPTAETETPATPSDSENATAEDTAKRRGRPPKERQAENESPAEESKD